MAVPVELADTYGMESQDKQVAARPVRPKGQRRVLRNTPTVVTEAILWKIPHNTEKEDIELKIGRYKKPTNLERRQPESLEPKSELTLDNEELHALLDFLRHEYEPFRKGVKAFIPLDRPFDPESAKQIRALFALPNKGELVRFILDNQVIPTDLALGLRHARRVRAVEEFARMLDRNLREDPWEQWFKDNSWVLGSQFVGVLEERYIDTRHVSDFLMEAYDGFLDVVEIKRPEGGLTFWATALDHGNYVPSAGLTKAVAQACRYIYEVEREANSVKFLERMGGVRTVKPRCTLVFGRSGGWNESQTEAYRILTASYHNLTILTYDHVLERARRICGMDSEPKP